MQDTRCEMQDAMVGSAKTLLGDGGKRFGSPAICAAKYRLSDDVMCKCCNTNILVMVSTQFYVTLSTWSHMRRSVVRLGVTRLYS